MPNQLKDDLYTALSALARGRYSIDNKLDDKGWVLLLMPYPDAPHPLHKDELSIQIQISTTGRYFTLYSPLAILKERLQESTGEHILRRHFYADQVDGASLAIQDVYDKDVLTAIYHWGLGSINPEQFAILLERFTDGVFTLMKEIDIIADKDSTIDPINK